MANYSTIDDMPNITTNFSDDTYISEESKYERIFLELLTFIGLSSVICNGLIIFVILKYKRMRQQPTNLIFLHVNILQATYFFATPLTIRIMSFMLSFSSVHLMVFCILYQIEATVMFAVTFFLILQVSDWIVKTYYKEKYSNFTRTYKFIIAAFYVLTFTITTITVQNCFRRIITYYTWLVLIISVVLVTVFIFVINAIHAFKKRTIVTNARRGSFGLVVVNICLLVWLPALLFVLVSMFVFVNAPVFLIFIFTLGFSSPIFNFIYLFYYDDDYSVFLRRTLLCKCSEYENERLEDDSVRYNGRTGVQIPEV